MEDGLVRHVSVQHGINVADVLILVVMEDGLVLEENTNIVMFGVVLILVVMEDGLVPIQQECTGCSYGSLNPCCNGRWSRTRLYKTILIINKL